MCCGLVSTRAVFYLPGVAPKQFNVGDEIELKVKIFGQNICFKNNNYKVVYESVKLVCCR